MNARLRSPSRRAVLAGLGAGLLVPSRIGAAPRSTDRKLLIVLCQGGWDVTRVFHPAFGGAPDMEADASPVEIGGFSLVDSPARPSVRSWFEAWHDRAAIIDGFEVRSITHERCLQLLLTGGGQGDDWPSILAASGVVERALPHLVLSGPSYNARFGTQVVRVGENGQLPDLIDGDAIRRASPSLALPSDASAAAVEAALRDRLARRSVGRGAEAAIRDAYGSALDASSALDGLDLAGGVVSELCGGVAGELGIAIDAFAADRARCAMIQYGGNCGPNWDQHSDIAHQSISFEELFWHLTLLTDRLASTPGVLGGTLLDEVTVLVCSEMGRHPKLNVQGGKDHWTYTSCLLFGAGVAGDVHVGGYDDDMFGERVDLVSGAPAADGVSLLPGHLGATLLALGGVDPAEHLEEEPIGAVLA
jgi:uncharacterized protein (DUF1501 family)